MDLIKYESISAIEVFEGDGLDPLLDAITKEVKNFRPDMTTVKGRKEIASVAYKVAKTKTYLDDLGKNLAADWKEKAGKVDKARRKAKDYLDELKDEVRAPLTAWETKEKDRVAKHNAGIQRIKELGTLSVDETMDSLHFKEATLKSISIDPEWDEFFAAASEYHKLATSSIASAISKEEKRLKEQAELEKLRKAEAERLQIEHIEKIAKEAAERARKEAEEEAIRKAEEAERKAAAERKRIEEEKLAAERREQAAKAAAERAKKEKEESEKRAEQQRIEREARYKREKEEAEKAAAERERKRQEEAERKAEVEQKKRDENKKLRAKVNAAATAAIVEAVKIDSETARAVVEVISECKIPNVKITY